jgi:hypothetical protein
MGGRPGVETHTSFSPARCLARVHRFQHLAQLEVRNGVSGARCHTKSKTSEGRWRLP